MNKFAVIHFSKSGLSSLCEVRTIEEAHHMTKQYRDRMPGETIDIMEIA